MVDPLHGQSFGSWQCHSCALSLALGFCSRNSPIPAPGREIQGLKGRYLGLAQHHRLQILHQQHPQLVPPTSCPAQKHLQAQRLSPCLQQLSCAPVARLGLPKIIWLQTRTWSQLCSSHRVSQGSSTPFLCHPPGRSCSTSQGSVVSKQIFLSPCF